MNFLFSQKDAMHISVSVTSDMSPLWVFFSLFIKGKVSRTSKGLSTLLYDSGVWGLVLWVVKFLTLMLCPRGTDGLRKEAFFRG